MTHLKIAQENRERMIEQKLNPELVKQYLLQTAELQRTNFEIIKHSLSETDQRPADSPNFLALSWDVKGRRNDQEGFIAPYSMFPPDDVRAIGKYKGWGGTDPL